MKDFHDLWAIPKMVPIDADALDAAIAATFARRSTEVPANRPLGLSEDLAADPAARRRWLAYSASLELTGVDFGEVLDDAWNLLGPSCERLHNRACVQHVAPFKPVTLQLSRLLLRTLNGLPSRVAPAIFGLLGR